MPFLLKKWCDPSVAGDGEGAVFVFKGGAGATGALTPFVTIAGDARERSLMGNDVSWAAGAGTAPPTLVIGAPTSYRTGTSNGTAYALPLAF